MIVEPSVLTEPTVTENKSYTKVREQLETWKEGVSGKFCYDMTCVGMQCRICRVPGRFYL